MKRVVYPVCWIVAVILLMMIAWTVRPNASQGQSVSRPSTAYALMLNPSLRPADWHPQGLVFLSSAVCEHFAETWNDRTTGQGLGGNNIALYDCAKF